LETATQIEDGELIEQTLNKCLEKTSAGKLIKPDDAEFASATPEAHRKGEKAYHVKAFRGSKDGKDQSSHSSEILLKKKRLFIFSHYWHLLRLQETTGVLPVQSRQLNIIHVCLTTDIQPEHRCATARSRRCQRTGVLHDRPS